MGFDYMAAMPFVLIFGVFYFLIIRPQQQKMKKHQAMLGNLRRGDRVVTNGGLIGTITKVVSDAEVQIEIADDVRIRHLKSMIAEVLAKTDPIETTQGNPVINSNVVTPLPKKAAAKVKTTKAATKRSKGKA